MSDSFARLNFISGPKVSQARPPVTRKFWLEGSVTY